MEQSPILGLLFHTRIIGKNNIFFPPVLLFNSLSQIGLSAVLFMLDYRFIWSAYTYTMIRGPSAQIVFGFEVNEVFFSYKGHICLFFNLNCNFSMQSY